MLSLSSDVCGPLVGYDNVNLTMTIGSRCRYPTPFRPQLGETKDDSSPRGSKRSMGDKMHTAELHRQQQQQEQENERSSPERAPNDGSAIRSPERKVLDKWGLPKEGREPSARPGLSASKRQAAASCVRVGSRVSFNTVVAAILIPSAKDLHAAARRELW